MNLDRLRWGEWIAAIAALDLLLVTFRAWYKVSGGDGRVTAWDALDNGRYLLIATAVVGVFLLLIRAAEDTQQLSFPPGWLAAAVGFACTVYVAYRLASPPSDNLDPDIGLYLGLVSALGVTIGGLLSAREPDAVYTPAGAATDTAAPGGTYGEPAGEPATETWSPAAPAASTSGWSPAAPAAPVPPATPAGALGGERALQSGDSVVLTAGGARFPAGTVAEVVEAFAGGALVEVRAPDGMAERFEVPESAYERAPAGGVAAAQAGESWSPAMPAPASDDWGFDEPGAARDVEGTATETLDAPGEEKPKKTPWWKREIGGGKKKDDDDHGGELAAAGAAAAGAAAVEAETNGAADEKPGFLKRLFGGGGAKDEGATETIEPETTPASDVAGIGDAAESDTAVDEPAAESAVADEPSAPEPVVEPEPIAAEPEPIAAEPEPIAAEPEPEPPAPEPVVEPEPIAAEPEAPTPEPEPEPIAAAPDPEPVAMDPEPEPEPIAPAPEPEVAAEPEPPAAPEPEVVASDDLPPAAEPAPVEPEPAPPAPEPEAAAPEPAASAPDVAPGAEAAGAGAAAAAAAAASDTEDQPKPRKRSSGSRKVPAEALGDAEGTEDKPKRKRSSGSRKVPKEALAGVDASQPKVGDEVQLKVGGGKFDAGTKGTVVDVFSAGVIVELSDAEGRTERLDLPFEAIGPADA